LVKKFLCKILGHNVEYGRKANWYFWFSFGYTAEAIEKINKENARPVPKCLRCGIQKSKWIDKVAILDRIIEGD
jgi:hypothetical protein